ncbi:hypothetical protein [Paenibacillus macerans]|uniref:Uncharacterized protein n=1 Tax=Paenibacillus macerans TaxID=44252 RepID=A0A090ZNW5_PAEMA|nr:hypothetical protein [Paenibacillus macerans]KFN12317.1 hypothetical protein DJ90_2031 [Paenibacillus macerans]MCY7558475.1 hypothetical protein [Paenibacillus macerans]MEC0150241.1 hypothetical protein [Paenibacillus macerans]SUA84416.1 Uncharacterised protein [Paenibacillus macerans]
MLKRTLILLIISVITLSFSATWVFADGDGNIDNGGGGMGSGTSQNKWTPGYDGVRITVIRSSDKAVVSNPIDYTNKTLPNNLFHFGKVSKIQYQNHGRLTPYNDSYKYKQPAVPLPKIISSGDSVTDIEVIKRYFCSEGAVKMVANDTGIDYNTLTSGDYKLLLEPIAYFTFQGGFMGMTAHEAALYDQLLNGGLRSKMVSLTHQNLPLAMFLETPDLGYPAWNGSTSGRVSNHQIITSLGLGIVRFNEAPVTPPPSQKNFQYRTNTDVITSVWLSTSDQITPDSPASVTFRILGSSYKVTDIVIPEGESQLVWMKWRTPSKPQALSIHVSSSTGNLNATSITASIVDLNQNVPPDPKATDRNDSFRQPSVPSYTTKTSSSWGVWSAHWHSDGEGHGWWEFDWTDYFATLSASQSILPDSKSPSTTNFLKSGYGIDLRTSTILSSNAPGSHITGAQTAVSYFPEFLYQSYWRLHDLKTGGYNVSFWLKPNDFSTYESRVHFTPIWYPDGSYTPITRVMDAWTPDGMLTLQLQTPITISGNLFSDWHIAPQKNK